MNKTFLKFYGSLLALAVAVGIFFLLMNVTMPQGNRELLIAFVATLFGAMATSLKTLTGTDDNEIIKELQRENEILKMRIGQLEVSERELKEQVSILMSKV